VRVTPRAGVDAVDGVGETGELRVRVRSAPADGAANKALIKVLAAALDVAPSRIDIVSGASSRTKRVVVDEERTAVEGLWPGVLTSAG
jgi:uncharacterized protein